MAEIDGSERRDRVDEQQGRVAGAVHCLTDFADSGCDPGGSFIVHDAHGFDFVFTIFAKLGFHDLRIHSTPPIVLCNMHVETEFGSDLAP